MDKIYRDRISKLRGLMQEKSIDTMIVFSAENRYYLSGFDAEDTQINESSGALIIGMDKLFLATDSRFETQAELEAPSFEPVIYKQGLFSVINDILEKASSKIIGFESTRSSYHTLSSIIENAAHNTVFRAADEIVSLLRIIKTEDEIDIIKHAVEIAEKAYIDTVSSLKAGMTEKEVSWILEQNMRNGGGDSLSFTSIIAYGKNSALPHAIPGDTKIEKGGVLLFDWGVKYKGYCSDTTRTVFLGEPDGTFGKVYDTVLKAKDLAIEKIKDGESSKLIDSIARDHIYGNGFEGKFGHGLGHGVGLEVHEAPRLSPIKDEILKSGMVVTVEPGVYLPEWGGIRLEDMVVVRENGAEILNSLSFDDNIIEI